MSQARGAARRVARGHRRYEAMEALESRVLLSATQTFSTLYNFTGATDAQNPNKLVADAAGNLYGVTNIGGVNGRGNVFEIAAGSTTPTILFSFSGIASAGPSPSIVIDSQGNIFGTTQAAGAHSNGSIWEISGDTHTFTTIHDYTTGEGNVPSPTITIDSAGNLFGTTITGGANNVGTIFEVTAAGHNYSTLYNFTVGDGGGTTNSRGIPLVVDSAGNVFGVTNTGSTNNTGQVFELASGSGTLTTLAALPAGTTSPTLSIDSSGNLFGTTATGGTNNDGILFEIPANTSTLNVLHNFNGTDGATPTGSLVIDAQGNVSGETSTGGAGNVGTVYELPAGASDVTTLQSFSTTDGSTPQGGLTADAAGNLYGVTFNGGANSLGTVFKLGQGGTVGAATHLVFSTQPATGAAGALGTVTVLVEDANGNIVTTDNSKVTIKIASGPNGSKLTGTTSVKAVNGVATFNNLNILDSGDYTLVATDGNLASATSGTFTLTASATTAAKFKVTTQPGTTAAGSSPTISITLLDKKNHVVSDDSIVTIAIAKGPSGAAFAAGSVLSVQAVNGVATFSNLPLDTAGKYSLVATDGAIKAIKTKTFTVTPDMNTAHLVLTQAPSTTSVVGAKLAPAISVTLQDQFGNLVKNSHSVATLGVAAGPAVTFGGHSTANLNSGKATFKNVSVNSAGAYTLQVSAAGLDNGANVPVTFPLTVTPGNTTIATPKVKPSYAVGQNIVLSTKLSSDAPKNVHYDGTAVIKDSLGNVLGTASVSTSGAVKATLTGLASGTYTCTINYTGDSAHTDVTSSPFVLLVV